MQWGGEAEEVSARRVRFDARGRGERFPAALFSAAAEDLCAALLCADKRRRIGVAAAMAHAYFADAADGYTQPETFHALPAERTPDFAAMLEAAGDGGGGGGGGEEEGWKQRAHSKIWAPLPKSFGFARAEAGGVQDAPMARRGLGPIAEEEGERGAPFWSPEPSGHGAPMGSIAELEPRGSSEG